MGVLYFSLDANFESCSSIEAKISKLDILIDSIFNTATKAVATGNYMEYSIDTGQTIQKVTYTSMEAVMKAISAYERQRQYYVNKLLGNSYINIGSKNLRRRNF